MDEGWKQAQGENPCEQHGDRSYLGKRYWKKEESSW